MLYFILLVIILFSITLNYHTINDNFKLKRKLKRKEKNIELNEVSDQINDKRFYKKYCLALSREIEQMRFLNSNMKSMIIENRSLINKFKKLWKK